MPLPLPRLNDDFPLHTLAYDRGTVLEEIAPEYCRQTPSNRRREEAERDYARRQGEDWLPVNGKPGWLRNGKGQLLYVPDLEKLGPRKGPPPAKPSVNLPKTIPAHNFEVGDFARYRAFNEGWARRLGTRPIFAINGNRIHFGTGMGEWGKAEELVKCDAEGWISYADMLPNEYNRGPVRNLYSVTEGPKWQPIL